jgi:NADPH-dependent 2,4-dienoyl-CoA reductase/sulfur reductase-like enzyme
MIHRPDFWDTIAQHVEVYEDDILELDGRIVRLKSGDEIVTDVLLCGTGFTPSVDFFDQDLLRGLGLPYAVEGGKDENVAM